MAKRVSDYLLANKSVDTSSQKGGIPGFSGFVKHTSAPRQVIQEAKVNKSDLTIVWLDLANAYGSIPHKVIRKAMTLHHLPEKVTKMVDEYFNGFQMRFSTDGFTTEWHKLEKGIVTGCTISPIFFVMGINLVIHAGAQETRGPEMNTGAYQPAVRGYMDDLTVTTATQVQTKWVLGAMETVVTWAGMIFNIQISRFMVIKKGKISERFHLKVQGEEIPSDIKNPIKCLGRWFDDSLKDVNNVNNVRTELVQRLKKTEKSGLPGKYKSWIYQQGILPRLMWLLMIYEVPMTTVEEF